MVGRRWQMCVTAVGGRLLALLLLASMPMVGLAEEDSVTPPVDERAAQLDSFAERLVTLLRRERRALVKANEELDARAAQGPADDNGPSPTIVEDATLGEAIDLLEAYEARRADLASLPIDGADIEVSVGIARLVESAPLQQLPLADSESVETLPSEQLIVKLGTVEGGGWTLVATDQQYGFVQSVALEPRF